MSAIPPLDFPERTATVNEQASTFGEHISYTTKRHSTRVRVAPVQGANANGERNVKGRLSPGENEVLNGGATKLESAGSDFRAGTRYGLRNGLGGTVNGKDMPIADAANNCTGRDARPATNLEDAHAGAKWQRIDDSCEATGDLVRLHRRFTHPVDHPSPLLGGRRRRPASSSARCAACRIPTRTSRCPD